MARLRASVGIDMTGGPTGVGEVVSSDEHTQVVRVGATETRYLGDFTYPNGDWEGTIKSVLVLHDGVEQWRATGLNLEAASLEGADRATVQRVVFSGNDVLVGSSQNDKLIGYAGNDRLNGGGGNDWLIGGAGTTN